jgi:hypothetical protein
MILPEVRNLREDEVVYKRTLRARSFITFEFAVVGLLTVPPKLILNEPLVLPRGRF